MTVESTPCHVGLAWHTLTQTNQIPQVQPAPVPGVLRFAVSRAVRSGQPCGALRLPPRAPSRGAAVPLCLLPGGERADKDEEHQSLTRRSAFIDLKNVGGGSEARERRVLDATERRRRAIVDQIVAMEPTHIAVCGGIAHRAFARFIWPHLREMGPVVFQVKHPSSRVSVDAYHHHVKARAKEAERLE